MVLTGDELLVWYGKDYAKDLGIALEDERKEKEAEDQASPNIDPKTGLVTIDPSKYFFQYSEVRSLLIALIIHSQCIRYFQAGPT